MIYEILYSREAQKDYEKIKRNKSLLSKVEKIEEKIEINPYAPGENLTKLEGYEDLWSRRINKQHRYIYKVYKEYKEIRVFSMWEHTTQRW
ncbi:MAG: Txe/YoeB family addiction module toxin [Firmicutes bacterium]|nr:Txe/YoeB family addiction module toxin [Bacillota bacterium]